MDAIDRVGERLAGVELEGVGDRLRAQVERRADRLRGFGCPAHRAGEEARDPLVAQARTGRLGLGAAALGEQVAELLAQLLLARVCVVRRLAVAQEEDPHSAAGVPPATTSTKFSRWRV